jgi:hypothetical protein
VNFYLFIANFELFPKKSVFWSDLFIGLRYNCINRTKYHLLIFLKKLLQNNMSLRPHS